MKNTTKPYSVARFIKGFVYALRGVAYFFKTQLNALAQLLAAIIVIAAGFFFDITNTEWLIVILCIAGVLAFEMANTAIEEICNLITGEMSPKIARIKDVAAGAVMMVATGALVCGIIIFYPYVLSYFNI